VGGLAHLIDRGFRPARPNHEVATADTDVALSLAQERQPHLILLNILMPGMDGVEVSQHLRADPATDAAALKRGIAADAGRLLSRCARS
jgi:CheY-like chemotaxis protein